MLYDRLGESRGQVTPMHAPEQHRQRIPPPPAPPPDAHDWSSNNRSTLEPSPLRRDRESKPGTSCSRTARRRRVLDWSPVGSYDRPAPAARIVSFLASRQEKRQTSAKLSSGQGSLLVSHDQARSHVRLSLSTLLNSTRSITRTRDPAMRKHTAHKTAKLATIPTTLTLETSPSTRASLIYCWHSLISA